MQAYRPARHKAHSSLEVPRLPYSTCQPMSSYQPGRIDTQVLSLAAPKKLGGEKQGWPGRAGAESHERGLPNPTAFEAPGPHPPTLTRTAPAAATTTSSGRCQVVVRPADAHDIELTILGVRCADH
jgi:hypothetical protein